MSIHTPLEERQKNDLEGAVPSEYTHDVTVTCDASTDDDDDEIAYFTVR